MAPTKEESQSQDQVTPSGRAKREKSDKFGRLAAFAKLKKSKEAGEKNKYQLSEDRAIYDVVDEDDYSEIVRQRQEEDWIIDDNGIGYVEDGREIFDEDLNDNEFLRDSKSKGNSKKKKNPNIHHPDRKPKQNIRNMFISAGTTKKKEKDVSVEKDDILSDIMGQIHQPATNILLGSAKKSGSRKKSANNPFSVSTVNTITPTKPKSKHSLKPRNIIPDEDCLPIPKKPRTESFSPEPYKHKAVGEICENPAAVSTNSEEPQETSEDWAEEKENETLDKTDMDLSGIDFDDEEEMSVKPAPQLPKKNEIPDLESGWSLVNETKTENLDDSVSMEIDSSKLPLTTDENGDQILRFYWFDAYEDIFNKKGVVYLFGKVWYESANSYVSCCVAVKNIERRIRILPRPTRVNLKTGLETTEPITLSAVYEEFNEKVAEKYKITTYKSKKVSCKYAFELEDVPIRSDYLEVRYSFDLPMLNKDLKGETFSHIFGTNTSGLEILLLDRHMKGPCWLNLKSPQVSSPPVSWCKCEAFVKNLQDISINKEKPPIPPLVVMTLNLRTLPNPKTRENEIIAAAYLVQKSFGIDKPAPKTQFFNEHQCVISQPANCIFPFEFRGKLQKTRKDLKVEVVPTERALLGFLLARIHKVDPDVIVGHDIVGFDMDILLHRISVNKIPHWSKIGRLKRSIMPKYSGAKHYLSCGRLLCDVKVSSRELVRLKSYDLTELGLQILKIKRISVDQDHIRDMYSTFDHLVKLIEFTLMDASYILRIMYELNMLPLALQITNICGNVLSRTLLGGRSERNEYLLLHAFTEKDFLVPDKQFKKKFSAPEFEEEEEVAIDKKSSSRKKPAYAGGLVLEPKRGFYDKHILLLDFNSLYPSIIQEYNICFTTVSHETSSTNDSEDRTVELPEPGLEAGILPTEIRKLVESRQQVKGLMKTPNLTTDQMMQYDIRQKALKLTANSMYGCLGFSSSRFYAKPLAALVTEKGREILMKTKNSVEKMNFEVIYGDTDSIMIKTNSSDYNESYKMGNTIKTEINKLFRLLEIDIDGIFKSMLLLKKKKYAAINLQKNSDGKIIEIKELKGLDIVRRDWCDLAKETGNFAVTEILSGKNQDTILENIHMELSKISEKVNKNEYPIEMFIITKQLTKNPEDYPDKKNQSHVLVAIRMNSKGGKKLRAGDTVPYVICQDSSTASYPQRAYHPEELLKNDKLSLDTQYYLAHQVHPVITRLCDPIEGTDAAQIAQCLGLNPENYRRTVYHEQEADDPLLGLKLSAEERYKDCEKFVVKCPSCSTSITIGDKDFSFDRCPNESCNTAPRSYVNQINNQLLISIRKHIKEYYKGYMKCDDTVCAATVRKMPLAFNRGHPICPVCSQGILRSQYTDTVLYNQLCYYKSLFEPKSSLTPGMPLSPEWTAMQRILSKTVQHYLSKNAYSVVNLTKIFRQQ
ncbi:DNA polymerase alpha catalytic subunit-like [Octopus vulgaris]|nr:DNA polymerase alpha catalytic subunit-like [Octopus vulgaris]